MHFRVISTAVAAVAAGAVVLAAAPASAAQNATVYVVHGIPGQPVDVYVNGEKTLPDFQPSKVAGPLDLAPGAYDIALTTPGGDPASPLLKVDGAQVPDGANLSLVAHLSADGKPALTPFVNDTGKVAAGKSRLVVRHTAAAPAVDVRAGGTPVFENLTNPKEAKGEVGAGTVEADVVLTGTDDVVLGPTNLELAEGTSTIVYAIGSAQDKTLAVTSQVLTGLHSAPGGVPAGSGGLAGDERPGWLYPLVGVGLLLLLGGAGATARAAGRSGR